jgi:hypothetical protein
MRFLCAVVFMVCAMSAHPLNVIYLWSVGDIGGEYVPENPDAPFPGNYYLTIDLLKFYWVETNTGLGINITALGYRQHNGESSLPFPPLELMWNPLSIKINAGYLNWGVYDRFAWLGPALGQWRALNSIGTRLVFSSHPFGRIREPHRGIYHANRALFFEYMMNGASSADDTPAFRVGISVDIGLLFYSAARGAAILAAWPFNNREEREPRSGLEHILTR